MRYAIEFSNPGVFLFLFFSFFPFFFNPLPPSDAEEKNVLEDLFSSVSSKLKKYHPSETLELNNSGIFQSLK